MDEEETQKAHSKKRISIEDVEKEVHQAREENREPQVSTSFI